MAWISDGLDALSQVGLGWKLFTAGSFAFAESGLGVGMFVPGETAVLILSASIDGIYKLAVLLFVVTLCSSAGDHVGYFLGRHYGGRLRETRPIRRIGQENWDRAQALFHRHGASAVFLTRLLPIVRTLTPATAGVGDVRYRRFLPASLFGAFTWASLYVCAGALAAVSVERLESVLGSFAWALLAVAALAVLVTLRRRRRRSHL